MASEAVNPWDKKCPQCDEPAQTCEMFCCSGYCGLRFVTPRFRPTEAAPEITEAMVERAARSLIGNPSDKLWAAYTNAIKEKALTEARAALAAAREGDE